MTKDQARDLDLAWKVLEDANLAWFDFACFHVESSGKWWRYDDDVCVECGHLPPLS